MSERCRLLVPDGSLQDVVHQLLTDAGIEIRYSHHRSYRGKISNSRLFPEPDNFAIRLRPQDTPWIIADRRAELGFTGDDLIAESGLIGQLKILRQFPLSRSGAGKTQIVLAVPENSLIKSIKDLTPEHEVATEYPVLANNWFISKGIIPKIRRIHGALEAYTDIVDAAIENVEWGTSLTVNGWKVTDQIMDSQTCLITYPEALLESGRSKNIIEEVCSLLDAVMEARQRRLVKCNVTPDKLPVILKIMPAADKPTINELEGGQGFAVESIVPIGDIPKLIVQLKNAGATAIFSTSIDYFVS